MGVRRAFLAILSALAVATLGVSACGGGGLVKQYEYDEDIYLSVDGSATIYLNASVPALVNLRGLDLDLRPTANVDRAKIRSLYTTETTRVTRVSRWRRFGRQFVQIRMSVDDVTKLGSVAPFDWATYQLDRHDDLVVYRQQLNAAAGKPVGDVGWKGSELIAVRLHLPSRIRYHNAGAGNLRRGNILVWEQPLTDRQAGKPLEIEARIEKTSILYSALVLFAVSGLLALVVFAALILWVVRKGRRAA
jgi:hypothetical protein